MTPIYGGEELRELACERLRGRQVGAFPRHFSLTLTRCLHNLSSKVIRTRIREAEDAALIFVDAFATAIREHQDPLRPEHPTLRQWLPCVIVEQSAKIGRQREQRTSTQWLFLIVDQTRALAEGDATERQPSKNRKSSCKPVPDVFVFCL